MRPCITGSFGIREVPWRSELGIQGSWRKRWAWPGTELSREWSERPDVSGWGRAGYNASSVFSAVSAVPGGVSAANKYLWNEEIINGWMMWSKWWVKTAEWYLKHLLTWRHAGDVPWLGISPVPSPGWILLISLGSAQTSSLLWWSGPPDRTVHLVLGTPIGFCTISTLAHYTIIYYPIIYYIYYTYLYNIYIYIL